MLGGVGLAVVMSAKPPGADARTAPARRSAAPSRNTTPPAGVPTGLAVGQVAPDIAGEDIDGAKFKLSDYRGKVVMLDFWGHW